MGKLFSGHLMAGRLFINQGEHLSSFCIFCLTGKGEKRMTLIIWVLDYVGGFEESMKYRLNQWWGGWTV